MDIYWIIMTGLGLLELTSISYSLRIIRIDLAAMRRQR
jgi:hypothetical protein